MKATAKIAAVLAAVLLVYALLAGALTRIFFDSAWVEKEYERIDIESETGWDAAQCAKVFNAMLDYSIGAKDELESMTVTEDGQETIFFNESELNHMKDVRALSTGVLKAGLIALIAGLALYVLAFALLKNAALRVFAKAFLITLAVLIVFIAAMAVWIAVDFNSFWRVFHIVFLDLESSTFDPAESRMIRICPENLFSDMIARFAMFAGLGLILPLVLCIIYRRTGNALPADSRPISVLNAVFASLTAALLLAALVTDIRAFIFPAVAAAMGCAVLSAVSVNSIWKHKNDVGLQ